MVDEDDDNVDYDEVLSGVTKSRKETVGVSNKTSASMSFTQELDEVTNTTNGVNFCR